MIAEQALAPHRRTWRALLVASAFAGLLWLLAARVLGPSDVWDQTQPKTVSYTTDIVANGRWILPIERGELPATKPPLYNWLAAPGVAMLGYDSEIAHKLPSVISLCVCWLIVVRLGNHLDVRSGAGAPVLGWLAAVILVANYPMFKLGYLARPDMLLALWLVLGWLAATALLLQDGSRPRHASRLRMAFWVCVALAGLTKGPAAILLIAYAIVASRILDGSWRAARAFQWWWGLPLALLLVGAWVWGAWRMDPVHVREALWGDEIYNRLIGHTTRREPADFIDWIRGLPAMAAYYIIRFLPWSLCSIAGMIALWRLRSSDAKLDEHHPSVMGWLRGTAVLVIVIIAVFTLSAGKRADYIAAAFVPGALLAAWWLAKCPPRLVRHWPWAVPLTAAACLTAMTWVNDRQPGAPDENMSRAMSAFIAHARDHIESDPRPVAFHGGGDAHLQAFLGFSERDGTAEIKKLLDGGGPFWLVVGRNLDETLDVEGWLEKLAPGARIRLAVAAPTLPGANRVGWPERLWLYEVVPPDARSPG